MIPPDTNHFTKSQNPPSAVSLSIHLTTELTLPNIAGSASPGRLSIISKNLQSWLTFKLRGTSETVRDDPHHLVLPVVPLVHEAAPAVALAHVAQLVGSGGTDVVAEDTNWLLVGPN